MKQNKGFTLLELMTVVAIMGVLAALAEPSFSAALRRRSLSQVARTVASTIAKARSVSQIKRQITIVHFKNGYLYGVTKNDDKIFVRYPADSNEYFDTTIKIQEKFDRIYINANGCITDSNEHPIDSATIQVVDTTTGETITLTAYFAGSVEFS